MDPDKLREDTHKKRGGGNPLTTKQNTTLFYDLNKKTRI